MVFPSQTQLWFCKAELNAAAGNMISKTPSMSWPKHSGPSARGGPPLAPSAGGGPTWPGVSPVCHRAFRRCSPGPVVEFTTFTERPEYP